MGVMRTKLGGKKLNSKCCTSPFRDGKKGLPAEEIQGGRRYTHISFLDGGNGTWTTRKKTWHKKKGGRREVSPKLHGVKWNRRNVIQF